MRIKKGGYFTNTDTFHRRERACRFATFDHIPLRGDANSFVHPLYLRRILFVNY